MRNLELLQEMFLCREQNLLLHIAKQLSEKIGNDKGTMQAWNESAYDIGKAAMSHVDRAILDHFIKVLSTKQAGPIKIESSDIHKVLTILCELFALRQVEKDFSFFASHMNLTKEYYYKLSDTIQQLCSELRPHAYSLVESFKIPDVIMAAPTAFDWKKIWSYDGI